MENLQSTSAAPQFTVVEPTSRIRQVGLNLVSLIIVFALLIGAVKLCQKISAMDDASSAAKHAKLERQLPAVLAKLIYREDPPYPSQLKPAVVYDGATSSFVIAASLPDSSSLVGSYLQWEVLAKTANGAFYVVTYRVDSSDNCDLAVDCMKVDRFSALSDDQARQWLFSADIPLKARAEAYRKVFKEEMPPTEVKG